MAGKTAVFEILLKNVAEAVLPEVNDEFAKQLGIADGDVEKCAPKSARTSSAK